jgi:hypothetical protein
MKAAISHVIGSHAPIELSLESADFDDSKFQTEISDLANKDGAKNTGEHDTELTQDPKTKAPTTPDDPTLAMHGFTMNGVQHFLWVEHEPAAVIKMASGSGERLRDKLAAEDKLIQKQKEAQTGAAADELADKQAEVRRIAGETRAVEHRLDDLQSESKQTGDVAGLSEIADELTTLGTQYEEGNLAEPAAPPATAGPEIDEDERWIIKSKADLDAVRAIAPDVASPPENAEVDQWNAYAGKYFPRRLAELESDFAKGKDPAHKGPLTWEGYLESEAKLGPVRAQKKFQPELRNQILAENPQLDPKNVEIDVGLSPTRKGVAKGPFYADVVVEDVSDPKSPQLEVYSSKVHNVAAARVSRKTDLQIQKWIEARMAEDVAEAADKYGHEVEFRRPRQSPAGDGRAGKPGDPKHPLYKSTPYVSVVHLVWKYSPDLIPEDLLQFIEIAGENYGVKARKGRKVEVRFMFSPQP